MQDTGWPMFVASVGNAENGLLARVDMTVPALLWMRGECVCPFGEGGLVIPLHETCLLLQRNERDLCMKGRLFSPGSRKKIKTYRRYVEYFGGVSNVWEKKQDFDAAEKVRKHAAAMLLNLKSGEVSNDFTNIVFDPIDLGLIATDKVRLSGGEYPGFAYYPKASHWVGPDAEEIRQVVSSEDGMQPDAILKRCLPDEGRVVSEMTGLRTAIREFTEFNCVDTLEQDIERWVREQNPVVYSPNREMIVLPKGEDSISVPLEWAAKHLSTCADLTSSLKGFAADC